jgi:hypothetical protein
MRPSQSNRAFADRRERCAPRQRFGIHRRAPFLPSCSSRRSAACGASNSTPGYRSDNICAGNQTCAFITNRTGGCRTVRPAVSTRATACPAARNRNSFEYNLYFHA